MLNVLVVGGAGFIGSHMVKMLGQTGCRVTTLDDLSSGHRDAVLYGDFVQGDMGDRAVLDAVRFTVRYPNGTQELNLWSYRKSVV